MEDQKDHISQEENAVSVPNEEKQEEKKEEKVERFCDLCRRSEKVTGPLIELPTGQKVCRDCMEKGMNAVKNGGFDFNAMLRNLGGMPGLSFVSLNDLPNANRQPEKKAEPEKRFSMEEILPPHKIRAQLDRYVIGQAKAKKLISVAVYNHNKRIINEERRKEREKQDAKKAIPDPNVPAPVEIQKSNILMIGPTGSGKTYLVQTLARLLDVPLAMTDATTLTEAGYIGDDIESVVSKLLMAAGNDVSRAEHGIIFIDEIDKIAKKRNTNQRDVSGEAVQQGLLRLLEGAEVEVPVGATSKTAMVPLKTVNTKNILFICGGAFPGLNDIIKERLNRRSSIGFQADLKDRFDNERNLQMQATVEDLRKFGMIPEFLGRLPILFSLEALTEEMLVRILKEPENAILRQYEALLAMDEVKLVFEDDALEVIAKKALAQETGARALRQVLEEYMTDIMYEIPKDDNIGTVVITKEYLENTGGPRILLRGQG